MSKPPMMPGEPTLDLNRPLPSKWHADAAPYAALLKNIRDEIRDEVGQMYQRGYITQSVVEAMIKARGLDLLARQMAPVDGPSYARAIVRLILALTIDE